MWGRSTRMGDDYGDTSFVGPPSPSDLLTYASNNPGEIASNPFNFQVASAPTAAASFAPWSDPIAEIVSLPSIIPSDVLKSLNNGQGSQNWTYSLSKDATSFLTPIIPTLDQILNPLGLGPASSPPSTASAPSAKQPATQASPFWRTLQAGAKSLVNAVAPTAATVAPAAAKTAPRGVAAGGGSSGFNIGSIIGPLMAPLLALATAGGGKKSAAAPKAKRQAGAGAGGSDMTPWLIVGGAAVVAVGIMMVSKK